MDVSEMRRRATEARVARLGTVTAEGRPHVVPCCFAIDGEVIYTPIDDVKPKTTTALRRVDNIRHHPDATVLVDHYDDDWTALWWIRIDGRARIVDEGSPEARRAVALLGDKYVQYGGRPLGPVIAIDVERWRAWP